MIVGISVMAITGLVGVVIGLRARDGGIRPNGAVGLRTRATRRSTSAWYAAQRASAPYTIATGATLLVGAGITFLADVYSEDLAQIVPLPTALIAVVVLNVGSAFGKAAAERAD